MVGRRDKKRLQRRYMSNSSVNERKSRRHNYVVDSPTLRLANVSKRKYLNSTLGVKTGSFFFLSLKNYITLDYKCSCYLLL